MKRLPLHLSLKNQRLAGVLLHPSSLPGKQSIGDLGEEARHFLHFMHECGLSIWQILPLGPTHVDGSPYQCLSVHAGNPELISLQWLVDRGWLHRDDLTSRSRHSPISKLLKKASHRFFQESDSKWISRYKKFTRQSAYWLDDFALFMTIKEANHSLPWTSWPDPYRLRDPDALQKISAEQADSIHFHKFVQFIFSRQWQEIREYAHTLNITLFGDMPMYVSMDSSDVWANKDVFLMDKRGRCEFVAGVPPDAFSEQGQFWGNPLYDWNKLRENDFSWWINRVKTQLSLFDFIRIDHFRGLSACWNIVAGAETAANGEWVKTPGKQLLTRLHQEFESLPVIAEDLGLITKDVEALRHHFELPGMSVLQFAFDGDCNNPHLPHNHRKNSVTYTGTHDNDTTLGWYQKLPSQSRKHLHDYVGQNEFSNLEMPWLLNRMALSSIADKAIIPMQDLLNLGSEQRMNTPGTIEGNWQWRFDWNDTWPSLAKDLRYMIHLYGRYPF